jgi:hypothetical protein
MNITHGIKRAISFMNNSFKRKTQPSSLYGNKLTKNYSINDCPINLS